MNHMQVDQALGQVRPILGLIGSLLIIVGLAKFFGVNISIGFDGLHLAAAGWLMKGI
jgi:hypothetical protein